ncbi:MAG: DUF3108 domain-containing protein [Gammaproteobacteria bacterium]|nr:DUF3108 domain-containing protein [Gammaproteobacteria bacterium]MYJ75165.1 DUF3108 domain-containing protein [Gammaproteobacteria bacterium]
MQRSSGRDTCLRVAFVLAVLLAGSANGSGLTEQVRTYAMTVELEDQVLDMVSRTTWTQVEEDGHDAWRVMIEYESTDLPASVDTIYLARDDLRPLRQYISQGNQRIRLRYTEDAVRGTVWLEDGTEAPVDMRLDAPIIGDVATAIAALPLAPNYSTTLNAFDPTVGLRRWKVLVSGITETIDTPAGPVETFPVEVDDALARGQGALYWVTTEAPHHVVRSESTLPPEHGGGTEIRILTSVSGLPAADPVGR